MQKHRKHYLLAFCLFVSMLQSCVNAQSLWDSSHEVLGSSLRDLSICPSRSVNYITDSLPQQCLGVILAVRSGTINRVTDQSATITSGFPTPTSTEEEIVFATLSVLQADPEVSVTTGVPNSKEVTSNGYSSSTAPSSITATLSTQARFAAEADQDNESESPLDNAKFLSFEEWRKQNLARAGQSMENVGGRTGVGESEPRRRPGGISNALDSLGEDTEIEIDFSGFVGPERPSQALPLREQNLNDSQPYIKNNEGESKPGSDVSGTHSRSKDAGKTCKERFNYASFDCAATVLKTNKECTGSTSVLVENKDTYMLNKCSADNKFFIVELCDDILIDTIVLANFEFFSSMFRTFRVSVSDRYPVKLEKWRELGTFEAKNSREVQAFLVEAPLIWARYLRVELLAYYGNEYYCPVSLLRVHGTTMMEEFNHDMKGLRGEEEAELENEEGEDDGLESGTGIVVADALKEEVQALRGQPDLTLLPPSTAEAQVLLSTQDITLRKESAAQSSEDTERSPPKITSYDFLLSAQLQAVMLSFSAGHNQTCSLYDQFANISSSASSSTTTYLLTGEPKKNSEVPTPSHGESIGEETLPSTLTKVTAPNSTTTDPPSQDSSSSSGGIGERSNSSKTMIQPSQSNTKSYPTSVQPSSANPTTQESFFKTIHKRLQLLESNSTLSLQYIEEQSRILRDAFSKVEKRQLAKTTTFLESLNTTVLTELRDFRSQYEQLWQSTVLELSAQRESSRQEVMALSSRLSLLADEIIFQKRMVLLQFVLILLCLCLIIISRASSSSLLGVNYPELSPLVQGAAKSSANLARYAHSETPNTSPSSTRPSSRYGLFGRGLELARSLPEEPRTESRDNNGTKSPRIDTSPPIATLPQGEAGPGGALKDGLALEGFSSSEVDGDGDATPSSGDATSSSSKEDSISNSSKQNQ